MKLLMEVYTRLLGVVNVKVHNDENNVRTKHGRGTIVKSAPVRLDCTEHMIPSLDRIMHSRLIIIIIILCSAIPSRSSKLFFLCTYLKPETVFRAVNGCSPNNAFL